MPVVLAHNDEHHGWRERVKMLKSVALILATEPTFSVNSEIFSMLLLLLQEMPLADIKRKYDIDTVNLRGLQV